MGDGHRPLHGTRDQAVAELRLRRPFKSKYESDACLHVAQQGLVHDSRVTISRSICLLLYAEIHRRSGDQCADSAPLLPPGPPLSSGVQLE